MELTDDAKYLLEYRYLKRDVDGNVVELPETMFYRVAEAVSMAEKKSKRNKYKKEFFRMMSDLEWLPNSPTLFNAGNGKGCCAACFLLPIEDKMSSIFGTLKHAAIIHQEGGGTGFSFDKIRPTGSTISSGGSASGPVSFMHLYDTMTDVVKQGGVRRGANMGVLSCHHPDIEDFINCKRTSDDRFQNFNLSVMIDMDFLKKAKAGNSIVLRHNASGFERKVNARDILDQIIDCQWSVGDPGILFEDTINKYNLTPQFGRISATNPCSEAILHPYESCVLGSLNLPKFFDADKGDFNWDKLGLVVDLAIRFLDDVIDITPYPLPRIKTKTQQSRKIGLGVMGWADVLIMSHMDYGSPESLAFAEVLMNFIRRRAFAMSGKLGKEKGTVLGFNRRNVSLLSIAPTGSLSIIAGGVSTGIEPHFHSTYSRNIADGYSVEYNIDSSVKTAYDITPRNHLLMASVFQKYVDQGVAKTVNLPNSASRDQITGLVYVAQRIGLKSITFYREGSLEETPVQPSCSLDECFI